MSGTEIFIILVVGIVVVGPKKLPGMMRTAGRWVSQVRRMTTEVRATSGIDKIIKEEGLENEIRELSSLTRSNVLTSLVASSAAAEQKALRSFDKNTLLPSSTRAGSSTAKATPAQPAAKVTPLVDAPDAAGRAPAPADGAPAEKDAAAVAEGAPASAADAAAEAPAAMGGPAPSAEALALIKPASGSVSRNVNGASHDDALRALVAAGVFSIRDREYPTIGCDAYDLIPDDIDDPEAYADDPAGPSAAEAGGSP